MKNRRGGYEVEIRMRLEGDAEEMSKRYGKGEEEIIRR